MLLEIKDLTVCYDTAVVLNDLSFGVDEGEFVSMVGPNGAGKTTTLRAIAGLVKYEEDAVRGTKLAKITFDGSIVFNGKEIKGWGSHLIAQEGLILCPERGRPFREMTVTDNLMAGAYLSRDKKRVKENLRKVYELFPILEERANQISGTLSGGQRSMLAIGRTLMSQPKLLLIDEPSVGLAPILKEGLFTRIKEIYESGVTTLLVEQDVGFAFELAQRNYVLSRGKVVAEGTAQELLKDETIRKTYLGI